MKNKIYIDDPVKRLNEGCQNEDQLPPETAIRFESGKSRITVRFCKNSGSLELYQNGDESQMVVVPLASNKIVIT